MDDRQQPLTFVASLNTHDTTLLPDSAYFLTSAENVALQNDTNSTQMATTLPGASEKSLYVSKVPTTWQCLRETNLSTEQAIAYRKIQHKMPVESNESKISVQDVGISDDFYHFFHNSDAWARCVLEKYKLGTYMDIMFPSEKIHLARLIGTVCGLCAVHKASPAVSHMQPQKKQKNRSLLRKRYALLTRRARTRKDRIVDFLTECFAQCISSVKYIHTRIRSLFSGIAKYGNG